MAKKKTTGKAKNKEFGSNPFSDLKGLSVSDPQDEKPATQTPTEKPVESDGDSFVDKMAMLGVKRLHSDDSGIDRSADESADATQGQAEESSDEEVFLQAMGELQVQFEDTIPAEDERPQASARRLKQLKQGRLVPEASLDLHGLTKADVAEKLTLFLQNAEHHGWQTVLVITGKGLHSAEGEPVLRAETERFLCDKGRKWVAEWVRAPKKYGGDGALVLFLRTSPR